MWMGTEHGELTCLTIVVVCFAVQFACYVPVTLLGRWAASRCIRRWWRRRERSGRYQTRVRKQRRRQRWEEDYAARPPLTPEEFGRTCFPPEQAPVAAGIRQVFDECAGDWEDFSRMLPWHRCADLWPDRDCLMIEELLWEIEEHFDVKFVRELREPPETVQELVDLVAAKVRHQTPEAGSP